MTYPDVVEHEFRKRFGEQPLIVRSPGRVNLIGEHTDYNLGFVLPAAIDKSIYFALAPREDYHYSFRALDMNDVYDGDLRRVDIAPKSWANYLIGILAQLQKNGHSVKGFNCVFGGDIPIGAGMSSSAAIETGLGFGLNELFNLGIDKLSLVKMAQRSENEFVGVQCGIMDQYANAYGQRDSVIRLDCQTLEAQYYPFDFPDLSIVLFDTRLSHSLASSEYNQRRMECAEAVRAIKERFPAVSSLRDVTPAMLDEVKSNLDPVLFRRAHFVVEENERVLRACDALVHMDIATFGSLMKATHAGLRDEYQVSCTELDFLVERVEKDPAVYGSRMMGGGFGGCAVNLIDNRELERVTKSVSDAYKKRFQVELKTYVTRISGGTIVLRDTQDVLRKKHNVRVEK